MTRPLGSEESFPDYEAFQSASIVLTLVNPLLVFTKSSLSRSLRPPPAPTLPFRRATRTVCPYFHFQAV